MREHEVAKIVADKELHKVNQLVIVWAFSLFYSEPEKVGQLLKVLEGGNDEEIAKLLGDNIVQFMLIGSNHNWSANVIMHERYPKDPNFSHMLCYIFVKFNYQGNGPDLEFLQIVSFSFSVLPYFLKTLKNIDLSN